MAVRPVPEPPRRSAPTTEEPGFYPEAELWLYGNVRLLGAHLVCIPDSFGRDEHTPLQRDQFETESEKIVLSGQIVFTGIHNAAHQRAAVVPLRWGAPRILVLSGGFRLQLELNQTVTHAGHI